MKVTYSKILQTLFSVLLVTTPLIMFHRTSELFEFNKLLTIYLITGGVLALWVARMIIAQRVIFRGSPLLYMILIFFCTQIISAIFSIDHQTSIYGYYGRFNGGLLSIGAYILLCLAYVSNIGVASHEEIRTNIEKLLKVSLAASAVVMVWGLPSKFGYDLSCLMFTGHLDVACWTEQFKPTVRVFSTLGQPNWFGTYMVIHFFIGVYFFLRNSETVKKNLYLLYLLASVIFVLFSRSRSSLLALLIGFFILGLYLYSRKSHYLTKATKKSVVFLVGILVVPIVILGTGSASIDRFVKVTSWPSLFQKSEQKVEPATDGIQPALKGTITDSGVIRKIVWQGAFALGMEYPVVGTGPETFAYSYSFLRPLQHNETSEWDYVYNKAHNEFFNYFATTGFLGLIGYVGMIGFTLLYGSFIVKGSLNRNDELLVIILLISYIGIGVTNFLGFSTTTSQLFLYMIPAWLVLLVHGDGFKKFSEEFKIDQDYAAWLVIPILILILTFSFVVRYFSADVAYAQGDALFSAQRYGEALTKLYEAYDLKKEHIYADKISQTLTQLAFVQSYGNPDMIVAQCNDIDGTVYPCTDLSHKYNEVALKGSPKNVFYYRTTSRNKYYFYQISKNEEDYRGSINALHEARKLAPTDPRYPYFQSLFALGKYENTKKHSMEDTQELTREGLGGAEFAIKLKPNYSDAYMAKGLILSQLGRKDEARQTFEYVLRNIDPGNQQFIKELESVK